MMEASMRTNNTQRKKHPEIQIDGTTYLRIPIKTHLIMKDDPLIDTILNYSKDTLQSDDILFVTEKVVAITQGRAIPLEEISPRKLAYLLSKFVTKTPAGIGLGMPETMEMALQECGIPRILFAAAASAVTKLFGKKGVFYDLAGYKAKSIDGPTGNTIPPYNRYVVLGPNRPNEVAKEISEALGGAKVAVVDINDLDGDILGVSHNTIDKNLLVAILKDNPLGQNHEQTPLGIVREIK
jgi:F420-0:gamma-glutamyl ligase